MEKVEKKSRIVGFKEGLKYHLVDTTALLVPSTPLFSAIEVGVLGMSDEVSLGSRVAVAALSYGGLSLAFARGERLI